MSTAASVGRWVEVGEGYSGNRGASAWRRRPIEGNRGPWRVEVPSLRRPGWGDPNPWGSHSGRHWFALRSLRTLCVAGVITGTKSRVTGTIGPDAEAPCASGWEMRVQSVSRYLGDQT